MNPFATALVTPGSLVGCLGLQLLLDRRAHLLAEVVRVTDVYVTHDVAAKGSAG